MTRNLVLIVMLVAFAFVASGCVAGPWTFRESVDDWSANIYADNTLIGTLVYMFVWPLGTWLGSIVDMVVFNNVAWWGQDLWDGNGTTFNHEKAPNGRTNTPGNKIMEQPQL
ncbi:MAG TPA: hypothetical protein VFS92_04220 [Planctomycetota bacterium]|nr:hypothetical protein [Planctomycetota bacterium]